MNIGEIELPDGYEVVGYRRSYNTFRDYAGFENAKIDGHYIDLAPNEAVVEASGRLWKGSPRFSLGYVRDVQDWLVVREATRYVQVDYSGEYGLGRYTPLYTYIDPTGGDLRVGDEVEVPVTYGTKVGVVEALGRGSYQGECKTVAARIIREAL